MKKIVMVLILIFLAGNMYAQFTVGGMLDTSLSFNKTYDYITYGAEEFANIRFQSRIKDGKAVVYGAVNLIAAAGDNANSRYNLHWGNNFSAALELERLYLRLNFEKVFIDAGLFRLPFGYSQVWGSSDFLTIRDPVNPNARPQGIFGGAVSIYPVNEIKLTGFTLAPIQNDYYNDGSSVIYGISAENHWSRVSAQGLYSFEAPNLNKNNIYPTRSYHRAGISIKADVEVGLVLDAMYTYITDVTEGIDGLSLSAGFDYSFFDSKLIVLAEYLYNGENSSTAYGGYNFIGMFYTHYIYSGFTWLFNDFTNINFALISCLDIINFIPMLTFNHDLFQGASLMITAQVPINEEVFNYNNFIFNFSARLRLRF